MWRKLSFFIEEIKSRKVFRAWLCSYLVLLAVSVAAGSILYTFAIQYARQEADRSQYQSLKQMTDSLDGVLSDISEDSFALLTDTRTNSLKHKTDFSTEEYVKVKNLADEISRIEMVNENIDHIYLYFSRSDYILGSNIWYQPDWSEKYLLDNTGISPKNWRELYDKGGTGLYVSQHPEGNWIYYRISYASQQYRTPDAMVLVYLKSKNIQRLVAGVESSTWIVAEDGSWLSSDGVPLTEEMQHFVQESEQVYEVMKSQEFYIKKLTSEQHGYSLVHRVSREGYLEIVRRFQIILYVYLIFCILVGGVMSWYLTGRQYVPLERLLEHIHRKQIPGEERSEYQIIERFIKSLEDGNLRLSRNQDRKEAAWRSTSLSALVKGRRHLLPGEEEVEYGSLGTLKEQGCYLLVGLELVEKEDNEAEEFTLEDCGEPGQETLGDVLFFMLANVSEEVFGERFACFAAEVDGLCVCLLEFSSEQEQMEEWEEEVWNRTEIICKFFREKAGVLLTGNISTSCEGAGAIPQIYEQIQEIIYFRDWIGTKEQVVRWTELSRWKDEEEQKDYQLRCQLLNRLEQHDYSGMRQLLEQRGSFPAPEEVRQGDENREAVKERENLGGNAVLAERIEAYMQEFFTNPELNVNALADQFGQSQSNLSQIFKRYYGMGPLEYLHRLRLEKAKEYMAGEGSIAAIAEKVGYYSSRPLIRCFKQYEGMTPSEYRASL